MGHHYLVVVGSIWAPMALMSGAAAPVGTVAAATPLVTLALAVSGGGEGGGLDTDTGDS